MRVAALYDIHGNLPALEAVLEDIRQADVEQIVVGGDVVPGPMPRETLGRLLDLDLPTHFIYGNGELAILAQMAVARTGSVTYWGTTSGARPPESICDIQLRHTAYDLAKAAERIRASSYPQAQDFAARNVLQPPSEKEMLEVFAKAELK